MQFSKYFPNIARSGNIFISLPVQFLFYGCCDWTWVTTKENLSFRIHVFFGEKGWFKNIFLRFARNIKILHHGKMLGISHSPGFSFEPLYTAEIFLKQLHSQSGSSLEGKKDFGNVWEERTWLCAFWPEQQVFLLGQIWLQQEHFWNLRRTDNNLINCLCMFTCNYIFLW